MKPNAFNVSQTSLSVEIRFQYLNKKLKLALKIEQKGGRHEIQ